MRDTQLAAVGMEENGECHLESRADCQEVMGNDLLPGIGRSLRKQAAQRPERRWLELPTITFERIS